MDPLSFLAGIATGIASCVAGVILLGVYGRHGMRR
jgi:hypothetical protein